MDIDRIRRIATFFRVPAEPAPEQVEGGVWKVRRVSDAPSVGDLNTLGLDVAGYGASPAEALASYQRNLVLLAAMCLDAVRNARARAHAFVLAADEVDAAIGAEMAPPTP